MHEHSEAIKRALDEAGLQAGIASASDLAGGCIHRVSKVTLDDGRTLVAKTNRAEMVSLFEEEAASLVALAATDTVLVPQVLSTVAHDGVAVLLMTALEASAPTEAAWRRLGRELAALHTAPCPSRYGFDRDNHLGTTLQPNTWCDDWVEFNARYRLGHQARLARDGRRLRADEVRRIDAVIEGLDRYIPRRPRPALLHGDLWSGNALPTADAGGGARVALIDPACSIGDGLADLAMMELFGGFPTACFEAYWSGLDDPGEPADRETRIAVYQLYHVLNHVNLFGRGYAGQAMALAARLG